MSYDSTPEDVAKFYKLSSRTIIGWADQGYPLCRNGEVTRVKLEGAQRVGVKSWRFNLKAVTNFIENLGDEQWVLKNVDMPRKAAMRNRGIGRMSSSLAGEGSKARLMALLNSQKATNCQRART